MMQTDCFTLRFFILWLVYFRSLFALSLGVIVKLHSVNHRTQSNNDTKRKCKYFLKSSILLSMITTLPLIYDATKIINMCSVHVRISASSVKYQNTNNYKTAMKQSRGLNDNLKSKQRKS